MDEKLLGKCGFYCGCCPTFIKGNCNGCAVEHKKGDCFTLDCVTEHNLPSCGHCKEFPCDTIINEKNTTVLDKDWLKWKKQSDTNR